MMPCWSSAASPRNALLTQTQPFLSKPYHPCLSKYNFTAFRKPRNPSCLLNVGVEDIAQIAHNKVVLAAGVSAAVGQLSKPFTSVLLYGKDLDFKAAFQAGGFPSTHSSAVVATATSLALERGFSDSIFGLSLVYAGLFMYDAQGVRREVGNHARILNKLFSAWQADSKVSKDRDSFGASQEASSTKEGRPAIPNSVNAESDGEARQTRQMLVSAPFEEVTERNFNTPLKESIGHTEVEVIAGALLGLIVSIAVQAAV